MDKGIWGEGPEESDDLYWRRKGGQREDSKFYQAFNQGAYERLERKRMAQVLEQGRHGQRKRGGSVCFSNYTGPVAHWRITLLCSLYLLQNAVNTEAATLLETDPAAFQRRVEECLRECDTEVYSAPDDDFEIRCVQNYVERHKDCKARVLCV